MNYRITQAAACNGTVATVTKTSSAKFYIDTSNGYTYGYVSFSVTTGGSQSFNDLWVKISGFAPASGNIIALTTAETEDGYYHVGTTGTSTTKHVYFFLKATSSNIVQNYNIDLYEGVPTGSPGACTAAQSSAISETGQNNSNTVSSVTYTAPYIGGQFTMTVIGDAGNIGSAGIFAYTPASVSTWNADCLELSDTSITLTDHNTGTTLHGLGLTGLSSGSTLYTVLYTFKAKCVTSSSTPVKPLSFVSSGANVAHTNPSNYGNLPPIEPATNLVSLTKSVSPAASVSGGTATYSVNLVNNGPSSASVDNFVDSLPSSPANATYMNGSSTYDNDISDNTPASSISNPSGAGQTKTWSGSSFTVPSGKTAQLTYQVTIPSTTGSYVNSVVANLGTTQIDQTVDTTNNSPATATYGVGDPSMAASTKTASDINGGSLQPGDIIEYTITATDTGTNNAVGVHISDTIDTNTQNVSNVVIGANTTDCGSSYSDNSTSTTLDITGVTVGNGSTCEVTFRVTVKASAPDGASILNSATIIPGNVGGINGNPSSTPMIVHKDPILSITNTENDPDNIVVANQVITYTYTITNTGSATASGVDLTGTVGGGKIGAISNRTLTNCGLSTTYVDTSVLPTISIAALTITTANPCVITYTATVVSSPGTGSVTNSVDITAAHEGGNDPAPVSASTLLIGAVATAPNLAVTVSENDADGYVAPGQTVIYTTTITNSGQTDATTSLTSSIPSDMGTPSNITYANCGSPNSTFSSGTLTIGSVTKISIAAANICTITFTVTVSTPLDEGTALTVGVDVAAATEGGNNPANVNATTLLVDATPVLTITITDNDDDQTVIPNQDITYTTTITNNGNGTGTVALLADAPAGAIGNPSSFSFSGCGSSYVNNSTSSVTISNLIIEVGTPCIVSYHVTVNSDASNSSTIDNTADISAAAEGGNNPIPVSAPTLTVLVAGPPNLAVTVSDNDADNTVTPGQSVTYTFTIENDGESNATTSLTSGIPSGMGSPGTYGYSNCGSPSPNFNAPTLTISSITINLGNTCTITFVVAVDSPLDEGTTLALGANVAAASQGGNDPDNTFADTLTVNATPNLSTSTYAQSDVNGGSLKPGDSINYTITIVNTGNGTATGVSLSNTMPAYLSFDTNSITFNNCGASKTDNSTLSGLNIEDLKIQVGVNCIITFQGVLNNPLIDGQAVNNSSTISAAIEGGLGASPSTGTMNIDVTPDFSTSTVLIEDLNSGSPEPGDVLGHSITLKNTGDGNATGVSLHETINSNLNIDTNSFIFNHCGSPVSSSATSSNLYLTALSISVGTDCEVYFETSIKSPTNENTSIVDNFTILAAAEGGDTANIISNSLSVDATPHLEVTITDDDTDNVVNPSQVVNMQVVIANSGNGQATAVHFAYTLTGPGISLANISSNNCGASTGQSNSGTSLTFTNLTIDVGTNCVIDFNFMVDGNAIHDAIISHAVNVGAATEGGNDPANAVAADLTVDTSNTAPDLPSGVSSTKLTGNKHLNSAGLSGAQLLSTLSDPNISDQVRYRIQIASDSGYSSIVIDYSSLLAAQGNRTFTYQENTGTYNVGSQSTTLADGTYYIRIRAEDEKDAISSWYNIFGPAFTFDNTAPVKPDKPFVIGSVGVGTATIGWDVSVDPDPDDLIPYRLEYSLYEDFSSFSDIDTPDLSNAFTSLNTNTHYYFRIYLRDSAGNLSLASDTLDVLIPSTPTTTNPPPKTTKTKKTQKKTKVVAVSTINKAAVIKPTVKKVTPTADEVGESTTVVIFVETDDNQPIKGAQVTLHSEPRVGYSDEKGLVTFTNVPIGNHTATVVYDGKTASTSIFLKAGTQDLRVTMILKNINDDHHWCWLWWLLLLIAVYLTWRYYRYKKTQNQNNKK